MDWCNLQRHDPERTFDLAGTKRKYGVVQHARCHAPLPDGPLPSRSPSHSRVCARPHSAHDVMDWWNSGAALNPDSPVVAAWMGEIAKRARHDAGAQRSSVRS